MKVLMRPSLRPIPAPNSIYLSSMKGKNISADNFNSEEYKNKLCIINTQEVSPTSQNRNLFNQRQFRGVTGSEAYVPSYDICKQYLNTTNIYGWEAGKVTLVEPGLEERLSHLLCYPINRTSSAYVTLESKIRPAGYVYLRVEYDTPCKRFRILDGSGTSGYVPVGLKLYFEDGTTRVVNYVSTYGTMPGTTYNFDIGIVACELVQRTSSSNRFFCSRFFAPVNEQNISTRYAPELTNIYLQRIQSIPSRSSLDYSLMEIECTHDVQDTSKVFIPRPFFLWQASGSIPPLKIQADVIMEGTKV